MLDTFVHFIGHALATLALLAALVVVVCLIFVEG